MPMLEFPVFPATLIPFSDTTNKPTQTAAKETKKMTSLNIEKDEEKEKDDTTLLPPPKDSDIDRLINELTETDKEGEEINPKRGSDDIKLVPVNPLVG
ncbi:hypothetical protein J1N35_001050 [Gossypium stocksii]|uniref:Uncharacterized protein n=1 Tax=Gossypium stocksii TaxID=47602 RepID=A0A9D3WGY2_9ROSI|nr:hypothetical protein J1N35_001050 [Gossypium stocksii]